MPRIEAIGTALPEHVLEQQHVRKFVGDMFGEAFGADIERLLPVFDNSQIDRRHFCVPKEWFATEHSFREKNDLYIDNAIGLSKQAIETCLAKSGMRHEDIDYLIFVSTTGLATPSIDARLIESLPFRRDIRRLPIWGLGCAGGASALSRAMEITMARPEARVLAVVVELCGLTFIRNDLSKSALIATSLFADGAAAVLVEGDRVARNGTDSSPRIISSQTTTMLGSLDVMGWEIGDEGFKVMISRDIPSIVRTFLRESIECFLEKEGLSIDDIMHYVSHPGGAKVIAAYEESLGLAPEQLRHTRDVLRNCGNISACSVLFVLECFMNELAGRPIEQPEYGLLGALGPGFSSELVLLKWGSQARHPAALPKR
jgi:alkylresorcinol/alkylpyrone synthase